MNQVRKQQILTKVEEKKKKPSLARTMIGASVGTGLGTGGALLLKRKMDRIGTKEWLEKQTPKKRKFYRRLAKAGLVALPVLGIGAGLAAAHAQKKLKESLRAHDDKRHNKSTN